MMNEHGKSDRPVVPVKSSNNAAGAPAAAEEMEGRGLAKEKDGRQNRPQTQCCARPVTSVGYPTVWAKAQARHHPRQEPGAVVPLAGIRAGGGGQPPSLPRLSSLLPGSLATWLPGVRIPPPSQVCQISERTQQVCQIRPDRQPRSARAQNEA
jgi:hypothetical protein